jgi:tetratricopeptide (TPR) repeat protein
MARHRFQAAEGHLKQALSLDPKRAQARRQLVDLYALQGRPGEIAEQARALSKLETLDFTYLYAWALGLREGTDLAGQTSMLQDAVDADPRDLASRLALAECLRKLGRLQQADDALDALSVDDPKVRLARAHIALDRGDMVAADTLASPRGLVGNDPGLAQFRGQLALLRGEAVAAVECFRTAIETVPENRDAQFGLSQALRLLGRVKDAEPYLKTARDRDRLEWLIRSAQPSGPRSNPLILQQIGVACLAVGHRDQARAWCQLALRHDPNNPAILATLERIGTGTDN